MICTPTISAVIYTLPKPVVAGTGTVVFVAVSNEQITVIYQSSTIIYKAKKDDICSSSSRPKNLQNCSTINSKTTDNKLRQIEGNFTQALSKVSQSSKLDPTQTSELLNDLENIVRSTYLADPRDLILNNSSKFVITMRSSHGRCNHEVQEFSLTSGRNIMALPCHLVPGDKDGALLITYTDLGSLIKGTLLDDIGSPNEESAIWVNSDVVTGAILSSSSKFQNSTVLFSLIYKKPPKIFQKLLCAFWDPQGNAWSENTCQTGLTNGTHINCSCSHLSSFAVLMAPAGLENSSGLTILSYIGLTVSLLCLCMSLLTFILCRSLRSVHTNVLTALCVCLFLGQLLILTGLKQTSIKLLCKIIAGGLQFFFLCAFCWMSIESVLLFMTVRNLRAVNYMTSQRLNFPVMSLLGFGIPALIVVISAAIHSRDYVAKDYCWLHPNLVWSFLGPACVFISANTVLLAFTVYLLRKRLKSLNTNISTLKNNRSHTYKALAQALILGCTWGIGYFQFGHFSLVFSYLFTICNCLQGAYIFIVHCLLNHQVLTEYRKLFCKEHKHLQESTDATLQFSSKSVYHTCSYNKAFMPIGNTTFVNASTDTFVQSWNLTKFYIRN
ncbi:adhesion G protein-coupled receptor E3-like [Gastrophryne carolinensis]